MLRAKGKGTIKMHKVKTLISEQDTLLQALVGICEATVDRSAVNPGQVKIAAPE